MKLNTRFVISGLSADITTKKYVNPVNNLHFKIIKFLPLGCSGHTFIVEQNNKKYIMKRYIPTRTSVSVFREYEMLSRVKQIPELSETTPRVKQLIKGDDSIRYLIYDYIDGEEVWDIHHEIYDTLPIDPKYSLSLAKSYIWNILYNVNVLHKQCNIVHLDIKPHNIIVQRINTMFHHYNESYNKYNIIDFGSARYFDHTDPRKLVSAGIPVGTRNFISPEAYKGEYNIASDTYSIGKILEEISKNIDIGENGNELLSDMLLDDPYIRPCVNDILYHRWFGIDGLV